MASRYLTLKQRRHELAEEARGLDLATEEGKARLDAIEREIATVDADILNEERRRELERTAPPVAPEGEAQVTHVHDRAADKPWGYDSFKATLTEFVQRHPQAHLSPLDQRHPQRVYQTAAAGEFLQAVYAAQTGQGVDPRLLYFGAAQGANVAVGPDGGFLVGKTMGDEIRLRMAGGQILSRVVGYPLDPGTNGIEINMLDETSRATGSRQGAVRGYWLDEGDAITASRPKFRKFTLTLKGLAALGYATNSLLRNVRALGDVMLGAFADELRFLAEDAIVNGSGAGQPKGILKAACLVSVAKEAGQAADTVVYENLSNMWARMYPGSRQNAVWLINPDVEPQLDRLALTAGMGALEPRFVAYDQQGVLRIKGRPVVPVEYAATLGDQGDIILADFTQYGWIEETIEQATSMHVAFVTNEMAFRVTWYVDGDAKWHSALTPYKGASNTQSPFVTLDARA